MLIQGLFAIFEMVAFAHSDALKRGGGRTYDLALEHEKYLSGKRLNKHGETAAAKTVGSRHDDKKRAKPRNFELVNDTEKQRTWQLQS